MEERAGRPASFNLVPSGPFDAAAMEALAARLESYPVYHDPHDQLYVVFGSEEERRETVALYARNTTPTFDVECFVQLKPERLLLHAGGDGGGLAHLREFATWVVDRYGAIVSLGNQHCRLEDVLPACDD